MSKAYFFYFSVLSLLLAGCNRQRLSVQSDYLSRENLASYHIGTPDPLLNQPRIGQRILVEWSLPEEYLSYSDLHMAMKVRFGNRQEIEKYVSIYKSKGCFEYSLTDEEYIDKEGIVTYKVDIIGGANILEKWRHQLWTELITLCDPR